LRLGIPRVLCKLDLENVKDEIGNSHNTPNSYSAIIPAAISPNDSRQHLEKSAVTQRSFPQQDRRISPTAIRPKASISRISSYSLINSIPSTHTNGSITLLYKINPPFPNYSRKLLTTPFFAPLAAFAIPSFVPMQLTN
jgi:hypothetical protein